MPITNNHINIEHIRVLELTQYVSVDELRVLRNAMLVRLRIRLMEAGKKNIVDSATGFISGVVGSHKSPLKLFA